MSGTLKDTGCKPQAHGQATPGGGPCPRCGRPRCSASAKTRHGERCRKNPHPGATICTNHGLTAAGRAAAEERVAKDKAEAVVRQLWVGLDQATPVKDPVDALGRLAGALEQLVDEAGSRVTGLRNVAGGEHLTQLRAEVVLFERALGHLRQLLVDMARLGIASRAVEVQQGQAEQMLAWLRDGLEAGAAAGVAREVLQVVLDAFLESMRRSRAGVVAAAALEAGGSS